MRSTDDRSSDVPPTSSPAANVFDAEFLARLAERDEPDAAQEAEWAGPWHLEPHPGHPGHLDGGFALVRTGESSARGDRPYAVFHRESDALLTLALASCRQELAYRLNPMPDGRGFALQSRPAWGETIGWFAVFDEDLVTGFSWLESLMRSPEAVALFLECCGKVVLERAGAILQERLLAPER